MRLTFLGTGAAEMYPAPFCQCPNCARARREGGKNIRANSAALVDEDILLDMNATCHYVAARLGISLTGVRRLLVTHPHPDHFAPERLRWRRAARNGVPPFDADAAVWSARYTEIPELAVYGNAFVQAALDAVIPPQMRESAPYAFHFERIEDGRETDCGDCAFVPVAAHHGKEPGMTHHYILRRGGKTLLYALDGGGYGEEQLALLAGQRYDCVVMEGTFGLGAYADEALERPTGAGHMNLRKDIVLRGFLLEHGCITEDTPCILSHLCPHYTPLHEDFEAIARRRGFLVAYDGMSIAF